MFPVLLFSLAVALVFGDEQISQLRKMPKLPANHKIETSLKVVDEVDLSYCEACWGVADEVSHSRTHR